MAKHKKEARHEPARVEDVRTLRECISDDGYRNLDPKLREDPGLLPLTEDPKERRLKRHTM